MPVAADATLEHVAYHESGHTIAAINFGIPIIRATIEDGHPHVHRGRYRAPDRDLGSELLAIMCLSGPAAEELICGPITDGSDRIDQQMARDYLRERYADARLEQQYIRMQLAAERLVSASLNQVEIVAVALLKRTSLTGDEIIAQLNGATEPVSWVWFSARVAPTITVEAAMASPNRFTAEEHPPASTEEADDETLREAFMKAISGDPQFQEARKSGRAYVIGGAKLPKTP